MRPNDILPTPRPVRTGATGRRPTTCPAVEGHRSCLGRSTAWAAAIALAASSVAFSAFAAGPTSGDVEKVVVKSTAHFGFDQSAVNAADRAAMLAEVGRMKDVTWQTVTATGFTDSVGDDAYNERLSKRRAAAVKSYLVGKGIEASMVRSQGRAEMQPVADNGTEAGRAANRRTEIEFQGVRPVAR
ncbi:MAG: oprF [Rhizobacter sp.]|nr:oprF [Rhizobacter sp.]